MDRRTFLGLLAGSVLFPGVPEKTVWQGWVEITSPDYDGRQFLHTETGELRAVSCTRGYHERNAWANHWQERLAKKHDRIMCEDWNYFIWHGEHRP